MLIPKRPLMFVDIEAGPDRAYVWLISVLVEGRPNLPRLFYAETPTSERDILNRFLSYRREFGGHTLCHYGGFDESLIRRQVAAHGLNSNGLGRWFDLHDSIKKSGIFARESQSSLKHVAGRLGYKFRHPDMDGISAPSVYERSIHRRDRATTKRLLEYGEDDVRALRHTMSRIGDAGSIRLDRSWAPPERELPPSFEEQCVLVASLKYGGASIPVIAGMFRASKKYVRARWQAEPEKWKGREVSFEAWCATRTGILPDGAGPERGRGTCEKDRAMRGVVTEQVSENVFLVRANGAIFQVRKDCLDGSRIPKKPTPLP